MSVYGIFKLTNYFQLPDGWYIFDRIFKYRMSYVVSLQESKYGMFLLDMHRICILPHKPIKKKTGFKCLCIHVLHPCYFVENKTAFLIQVHNFSAAISTELFLGWNNNHTVLNH